MRGSLAEQLADFGKTKSEPANDNKQRKETQPRYRGTLPALRWLWENKPDLAKYLAEALPRPASNWFVDVEPSKQEIRPTVGELIAASQDPSGASLPVTLKSDETGERATIGTLKFLNGKLMEWGATLKGRKLKPKDATRVAADKSSSRNPAIYINRKSTTPSPHEATHYHRPFSGEPAISSMYDPLPGVEASRDLLRNLGVDGSKQAIELPFVVTKLPDAIAEGAGFLGGVSSPKGNSSSGAIMWDAPEERKGSVAEVLDEVAARGSLKSLGVRLGYSDGYADRAGKAALIETAKILKAANENTKSISEGGFRGAV